MGYSCELSCRSTYMSGWNEAVTAHRLVRTGPGWGRLNAPLPKQPPGAKRRRALNITLVVLLLFGLVGCIGNDDAPKSTLRLVTGTENQDFEKLGLFDEFEKSSQIELEI